MKEEHIKMKIRKIKGPLRVHSNNPRYFADRDGNPVYLAGSHNWSNIQEIFSPNPEIEFDYSAHIEWLEAFGHNYTRGWHWEHTHWNGATKKGEFSPIRPLPYARTGPGNARDGKPKYDLVKYNQDYFDRLRQRIIEAGVHGIYFSVMLFQGFSVDMRAAHADNPWNGHPYNKDNNVNGIDGSAGNLESGRTTHTLKIPEVNRLQEAYVRKVIDTVNDLDNVLYEIGNEHYEDSFEWQCYIVNFIKDYEKSKPKQHLVGITSGGGSNDAITNAQLFSSPADWISPRQLQEEVAAAYCDDPPPNDGRKVIIADTDHLWGLGGSVDWVWKSFTRGLHLALMDPYEPMHGLENYPEWAPYNYRNHSKWGPIRKNMGYSRYMAERIDLAAAVPQPDLASSGYCLANYGKEYLIYIPGDKNIIVNTGEKEKEFLVEWLNPRKGQIFKGKPIIGEGKIKISVPLVNEAVLYLGERKNAKS